MVIRHGFKSLNLHRQNLAGKHQTKARAAASLRQVNAVIFDWEQSNKNALLPFGIIW